MTPLMSLLTIVLLPFVVSNQAVGTGSWEAVFTGPIGPRPKMVDVITFRLEAGASGLKGTARAGIWPGDLDVSDVKVDGNTLTFTGTARKGWTTYYRGRREDHCCPKLLFRGTIRGDEMDVALVWSSTERDTDEGIAPLPMIATRVRAPGSR